MAGTRTDSDAGGFTDEEKAAMKERAEELKAAKRGSKKNPEQDLLAKIAEMPDDDRLLAERLHALAMASAPDLEPRTWYGMPAYARGGKIVFFFQPASKFKARYSTLGFNDDARLDDGAIWPTSFAVTTWNDAVQNEIWALIEKALS